MSNSFLIRKMEPRDGDDVYSLGINQKEFSSENGSFWTKEQLEKWCQSQSDILLVAEKDNIIVGFSLYAAHTPTGKVTCENLYVDQAARGLGIAGALIEEGLKRIKELGYPYVMFCVNAKDRESFASFLEKYGFKKGAEVLWVDKIIS